MEMNNLLKKFYIWKSLIEELPITLNEKEKSKEIVNKIVILVSEGDGYQYVYYF